MRPASWAISGKGSGSQLVGGASSSSPVCGPRWEGSLAHLGVICIRASWFATCFLICIPAFRFACTPPSLGLPESKFRSFETEPPSPGREDGFQHPLLAPPSPACP